MRGRILVLNAGSSSIKFSVYDAEDAALHAGPHGAVDGIGGHSPRLSISGLDQPVQRDAPDAADHAGAFAAIHDWLNTHHAGEGELAAIGHRVVHGGERHAGPVRLDDAVVAELADLTPLAPLHQPHAIAAIRAARLAAPAMPQYACFDTAFHRSQPKLAQLFALPRAITAEGVRRYGFHGISYEYIASVLPQIAPDIAGGRVVVAHLGNGASLCAIAGGRSVASTMGFTALDGLMMGTRTGNLDPGVVLYLIQQRGMSADAVSDLLYRRSGLLGVSGLSPDMRELLASDAPAAREAVDLFCYRVGRELGSLVAALGGLDALVFTAGIGEHAAPVREAVVRAAAWTGLQLAPAANAAGGPRISPTETAPSAWVIPTDENLMIARHVARLHDSGEV